MAILLAFFFFFLYVGEALGLNIGLGPGMSVKNLLLYASLVGIAINAAVARNRRLDLLSVLAPFGILFLYALFTFIVVISLIQYPDYSARRVFIDLKSNLFDHYITFLVFFFGITTSKSALSLLRAIIAITVVGVVVALIDTFNTPNLGLVDARARGERFVGFIGSANGYGMFLVLMLPFSIGYYLSTAGIWRVFAGIGVFATAMSLLLTGSRGAYAGLVFGGVAGALYLRKHIRTAVLMRVGLSGAVVLAITIFAAIVLGYGDVFFERFSRLEGSSHFATSGRSTIWAATIASMVANPLSFIFGFGYDAYANSREFYAATHNTYLRYLYDLGLIGLTLYVVVFANILRKARRSLEYADAVQHRYLVCVVFGLFGFMVSIFFSEYYGAAYLLWALLGVMMRIAVETSAESMAAHSDVPASGGSAARRRLAT